MFKRIISLRKYPGNGRIIDAQMFIGFMGIGVTKHVAFTYNYQSWFHVGSGWKTSPYLDGMLDGFFSSNAIQWVEDQGFLFEEDLDNGYKLEEE